jgi:hypothetical protein
MGADYSSERWRVNGGACSEGALPGSILSTRCEYLALLQHVDLE